LEELGIVINKITKCPVEIEILGMETCFALNLFPGLNRIFYVGIFKILGLL
jgi:hypothetical protein